MANRTADVLSGSKLYQPTKRSSHCWAILMLLNGLGHCQRYSEAR
jgi:hypothetical protein